jgi:hypothetical protein
MIVEVMKDLKITVMPAEVVLIDIFAEEVIEADCALMGRRSAIINLFHSCLLLFGGI